MLIGGGGPGIHGHVKDFWSNNRDFSISFYGL
jgi:hypothetical protein